MIDVFGTDRAWVFSGIGVSVLGAVVWLVRRLLSRRAPPVIPSQRSGAHSTNLQAGGDINIGGDGGKHEDTLRSVLEALKEEHRGNRPDVTLEVSDETKQFLVKNSGPQVAVDISAGDVRVPIPGEPTEEYKKEAAKLGKNIQSELVIKFGHVQTLSTSDQGVQLAFCVEGWSSLTDLYMLMEVVATPWPSLTPPRKRDAPPWSRTDDENQRSRIGRAIQIHQGVDSSQCELALVLSFSNTGPPKRTWHSHCRLTYSVATKKLLCHHDSTDEARDGTCSRCAATSGPKPQTIPRRNNGFESAPWLPR